MTLSDVSAIEEGYCQPAINENSTSLAAGTAYRKAAFLNLN
jgi:hypothetical protein